MSAESQWDIQTALYSSLKADTALSALLSSKIFDYVPEETPFPYLVLGATFAEPFDTQVGNGLKLRFSVQNSSSYQGMQEIKQIMQAVYDVLHEKSSWTIVGQDVVSCRFVSAQTIIEKDGKTRVGIQNFEMITEEIV